MRSPVAAPRVGPGLALLAAVACRDAPPAAECPAWPADPESSTFRACGASGWPCEPWEVCDPGEQLCRRPCADDAPCPDGVACAADGDGTLGCGLPGRAPAPEAQVHGGFGPWLPVDVGRVSGIAAGEGFVVLERPGGAVVAAVGPTGLPGAEHPVGRASWGHAIVARRGRPVLLGEDADGLWSAPLDPDGAPGRWTRSDPPLASGQILVAGDTLLVVASPDLVQSAPLRDDGVGPFAIGFLPAPRTGALAVVGDRLWAATEAGLFEAPVSALPNPIGAWRPVSDEVLPGVTAACDGLASIDRVNGAVVIRGAPLPRGGAPEWRWGVRSRPVAELQATAADGTWFWALADDQLLVTTWAP